MKWAIAICSFLALLDTSSAWGQQFPTGSIERIKQSLAPIVCVGQRDDKTIYLISVEGTGFFVASDGTIVTAGHVAKGIYGERLPVCAIRAIYVPVRGWDSSNPDFALHVIPITQCWYNDDVDVGVCLLSENPFSSTAIEKKPQVAEFSVDIQADGLPVAFSGFPLSFLQPITSQGTIGTYRGRIGDNIGPRDLIIDKNAWPGASGSPVYTKDAKVVGVLIQRGFNDASGLAFARSSVFAKRFLADTQPQIEAERKKQETK